MKIAQEKATVLIEALPYIRAFKDRIIVIKYGGSTIEEETLDEGILRDVFFMASVGMRPLIVHGGGKHISRRLNEKGVKSSFVQGLRVTDERAIEIVEEVLVNEVNAAIVNKLREFGCKATSVSGKTGGMVRVNKMTGKDREGKQIDWGFVGRVKRVNPRPLFDVLLDSCVPVVAPMGVDDEGKLYNVNADTVAAEIASSLTAEKLVYLTDVPGILRNPEDEDSLISTVKSADVAGLIEEGVIAGGMLPKVDACLSALKNNVHKTHIISGRVRHSLLLEIFTAAGIGTQVVK
jgi:acetylglutamate kinase